MCSWCWGFQSVLEQVEEILPEDIPIQYVMGGLAKDSDAPMPDETKEYVKGQWNAVTERTGAEFNWEFWERCEPRRSTYPACRAVLAASTQLPPAGPLMYHAIQRAYYLEAQNPSDHVTLISLAGSLGLDVERFSADLQSPTIEKKLQEEFALRRSLAANQFPSLVFEHRDDVIWLASGYEDAEPILEMLNAALIS